MRRMRSGCCARAVSGHCRCTADKTDELAPLHGPLKTHLVQGLKLSILRRSGEREMFRPNVRFGS
jgi:hypothetical protein